MAGQKNILIGVTASIAAYKSCELITSLRREGYAVKVAMSPDSHHFITPLTLQTLSVNKVISDMFALPEEWDVCHVSLAKWADLILVAPASADMIAKLAHGRADCIISATILSAKADVLITPAMNDNMYRHPSVQQNIRSLKRMGYKFIGPKHGRLACGDQGIGHIAGTKEIVLAVKRLLK
ncbi:MAG: hypothetical protein JW800_01925 [Candidatus Omnitrophica bacterium]|nr:hypothetical protein [Candidatus Omnitrophota bacterium]